MENKYTKFGVFLARMQPFHNAHLFLIKKALEECSNVCIVIGSSNKCETLRNPYDKYERVDMLISSLKMLDLWDNDRITIKLLPDLSSENNSDVYSWGHYLYYNIVSHIENRFFSLYYNDEPSIVESWLDDEIKDYINLRVFPREETCNGLSATRIRQAIVDDDRDYLSNNCNVAFIANYDYYRDKYLRIFNNPKSDFEM